MEENKKSEYVTKMEFEGLLGEQTKSIIEAVGSIMDKRTGEVRKELYIVRDELNEKIDGVESRLGGKIDDLSNAMDGYVKAQEDFKQDFVIMKEEVRQIKQVIKDKLGLEIKAI